MKRVLLLVCLIVSLVQLDWERDRVYLLSSIASVSFLLVSELIRRRKIQNVRTSTMVTRGGGGPSSGT